MRTGCDEIDDGRKGLGCITGCLVCFYGSKDIMDAVLPVRYLTFVLPELIGK